MSIPLLDLTPDELLSTTRAVRKRLDLSRPVEPEIIRECIELATQAPTGSNSQHWHFVIVFDEQKRKALARLYRQGLTVAYGPPEVANALIARDPERIRKSIGYLSQQMKTEETPSQARVLRSAMYLAQHLHEVPVFLIPCIEGRFEEFPNVVQASMWGSLLPAVWSFMLAARARGLGSSLTTVHLFYEEQAAQILGILYENVTQAALIPVAYTNGTDFKPGTRKPVQDVLHWDQW